MLMTWEGCVQQLSETLFYCDQIDYCFVFDQISFNVNCDTLEATFYDNPDCKPDGLLLRYDECFNKLYSISKAASLTTIPSPTKGFFIASNVTKTNVPNFQLN